jgi:hypothetical protein
MQTNSGGEVDLSYDPGHSLGGFSNLSSLSYEWYRSGASTTSPWFAPSLALHVTNGVASGYLVYELAYNGYPTSGPAIPTNGWNLSTILSETAPPDSQLWAFANTFPGQTAWTIQSLGAWQAELHDYRIDNVTLFIGSGWPDSFTGAVDGVTIGFAEQDAVTFDFEVQPAVPEPASVVSMLIAGGFGAAGAAYRRRRAR